MNIRIDHKKLLVIENEKIPQTKEYTYNVGGYTFSDYDQGIIILHKKELKIVNLKNLGDGMSVIYYKEKPLGDKPFSQEAFEDALRTFQGFNEDTGEKYFFIPGLGDKDIQEKNALLQKVSQCEIKKTDKGAVVELQHAAEDQADIANLIGKILSYLFGLTIMYGKFDAKNSELTSIKIQLPLFGQYLKHQEDLDKMVRELQQEGIFLKTDKLTNKNGITYQISSNDYELLEIFAKWYEPIEKFTKITKRDFTDEMKSKLVEFLETNAEIPADGKAETIEKIKDGVIKFLMK